MSDHEDTGLDTGYSTPVPELDDHRHQSVSVQRRGTADTMASAMGRNPFARDFCLVNEGLLQSRGRDAEEAIVDEDTAGASGHPDEHAHTRSRRGTVTTMDPRSLSPRIQ